MFADNYLEIVKKRIYNNKKGKESAQYTLYTSLLTILKLIAPITPFITEEIYQTHFKKNEKTKSIHLCEWPKSEKGKETKDLDLFINLLGKIRQAKTNAKKSMNVECVVSLSKAENEKIKDMLEDLKDVMNAKEIKTGKFKVEFD
tara:strand:- start:567 stop:1001 length:435 start_codon:yes stop_codon:yes gene_type:complete